MKKRSQFEQQYLLLCKATNTIPFKHINKLIDISLIIEINTLLKSNNCIELTNDEIECALGY